MPPELLSKLEAEDVRGINSGTWMVPAICYPELMATWRGIIASKEGGFHDQPAFNQLVYGGESGFEIELLPIGQFVFPLLSPSKDRDMAKTTVLHLCGPLDPLEKLAAMRRHAARPTPGATL